MTLTHLALINIAASLVAMASCGAQQSKPPELAHNRTEFSFTANGPLERVAPLFGAHEERKWAEGWDPQFLYPQPAQDREGMVFQIAHREHTATWVNTAFDLKDGHIQYTYVLGGAMATLIDIHLAPQGEHSTRVNVVYERTALVAEANDHVQHFAEADRGADKEWEQAINRYLEKSAKAQSK
jgi:hypothetical protein